MRRRGVWQRLYCRRTGVRDVIVRSDQRQAGGRSGADSTRHASGKSQVYSKPLPLSDRRPRCDRAKRPQANRCPQRDRAKRPKDNPASAPIRKGRRKTLQPSILHLCHIDDHRSIIVISTSLLLLPPRFPPAPWPLPWPPPCAPPLPCPLP